MKHTFSITAISPAARSFYSVERTFRFDKLKNIPATIKENRLRRWISTSVQTGMEISFAARNANGAAAKHFDKNGGASRTPVDER